MKGKCPKCFGEKDGQPCEECNDTGQVDFTFAQGEVWLRTCTSPACDMNNAGTFVGPPEDDELNNPEPCIFCGAPTMWEKVG
jgi:hypothetical protein